MGNLTQKTDSNGIQSNQAKAELRLIKRRIVEICGALSETECEAEEVINMLHRYIIKGDRILYSYISDYIYALSIQKQGQITNNIEKLYEYTFSNEYNELIEKFLVEDISEIELQAVDFAGLDKAIELEKMKRSIKKEEIKDEDVTDYILNEYYSSKIRQVVVKLMDHINLATYQYIKLNHDDEYFENKIGQYGEKLNSAIDQKLNESSKENMNQLISLIGIFTALSFMVFGGMTSLDSLFSQIQGTHTLKLVLIGSLWGLALFNLLSVFEYFVSRVAGKSFKYTDDPNASFYQKYPLVLIGNTVLGTIFLVSAWLYLIALEDMGGSYIEIVRNGMPVMGILGVIVIIVGMGIFIYVLRKKKNLVPSINDSKENADEPNITK